LPLAAYPVYNLYCEAQERIMIYSASRRTDLTAFYPDYLAGKVARSRKLEGVVVWTKDPRNLVTHPGLRAMIARYPVIVQLTLTGLGGGRWEPGVPPPEVVADAVRELSPWLPTGAIRWRFDPLIADDSVAERFLRMLALLRAAGAEPEEATVSFPDHYPAVRARLAGEGVRLPLLTPGAKGELLTRLYDAGGIPLALCCEPALLRVAGTRPACCVSGALFDRLYGTRLGGLGKDQGQRRACGCVVSTDIGSYAQRCPHNCRYCYATPASDPSAPQ